MVGVFDLASNVSEGIRNTTMMFEGQELERMRYPRYIGQDGILKPYNTRESLGAFWLKEVDGGKLAADSYLAHIGIVL